MLQQKGTILYRELFIQGRDMLTRTKKEMVRIYQKFSKSITAMKSLSEDDKHVANEYLKTAVKAQHAAAEQAWKAKEEELLKWLNIVVQYT